MCPPHPQSRFNLNDIYALADARIFANAFCVSKLAYVVCVSMLCLSSQPPQQRAVQPVLTCFFNRITLNRSKSVKFLLLCCCSLFFAHDDSVHCLSISAFSQALATGVVPAALGSFGIIIAVRETALRAIGVLGHRVASFFDGPSTRTCTFVSPRYPFPAPVQHTLLGSIISTMAASLPSNGPLRM